MAADRDMRLAKQSRYPLHTLPESIHPEASLFCSNKLYQMVKSYGFLFIETSLIHVPRCAGTRLFADKVFLKQLRGCERRRAAEILRIIAGGPNRIL
jgi:hypothetical protein